MLTRGNVANHIKRAEVGLGLIKGPLATDLTQMLFLFSQVWSSVCFSKLKGSYMETQGTVWESDYWDFSALPEGARLTPQCSFVEFYSFHETPCLRNVCISASQF